MQLSLNDKLFCKEATVYYQDQRAACYETIQELRGLGASATEIVTLQINHAYYHERVISSLYYYNQLV